MGSYLYITGLLVVPVPLTNWEPAFKLIGSTQKKIRRLDTVR